MSKNTKSVRIFTLFILGLLVLPSLQLPVRSDGNGRALEEPSWAVLGHDRKHTGLSPNELSAANVSIKWKFEIGNIVLFPPVVGSDGTVYSGSYNSPMGILHAINPDGTLKWQYQTTEMCNTQSPAIDKNGVIYIGTLHYSSEKDKQNHLWAINPDGTKKWAFDLPEQQTSGINIAEDGTIYFGAGDIFYALSPEGTMKWKFDVGSNTWDAPAIADDGTIYLLSGAGKLFALNPDGSKKWEYNSNSTSSPTIGPDGTIYIKCQGLCAIGSDGILKWSWQTSSIGTSISIGTDGVLYFNTVGGRIVSLYPNNTINWLSNSELDTRCGSRIVIDNKDTIFCSGPDQDGATILAVNKNGTLRWLANFTIRDPTALVMGEDGTLYLGSTDANIYAIGEAERVGPPTPPRNMMVMPGDGYVNVVWDRPKSLGGSTDVTYVVYRGSTAGSILPVGTIDGPSTTYHDVNVTNGATYFYNLKARTDKGDSDLAIDAGMEPSAVPQKDETPPTVEINGLTNGSKIKGKTDLNLDGTTSDNFVVTKVEVSTDGKNWNSAIGTDTWSYNLHLKDGTNTVHVRASDASGNTATKIVTFTATVPKQPGPGPIILGSFNGIAILIIVLMVIVIVVLILLSRSRRSKNN
jgi:outer membrane protein assembly factor BamB